MKIIKTTDPEILKAVTDCAVYAEALTLVRQIWSMDDAIDAIIKKHELVNYMWQLVEKKYPETGKDPEYRWQAQVNHHGGVIFKRPD